MKKLIILITLLVSISYADTQEGETENLRKYGTYWSDPTPFQTIIKNNIISSTRSSYIYIYENNKLTQSFYLDEDTTKPLTVNKAVIINTLDYIPENVINVYKYLQGYQSEYDYPVYIITNKE